MGNLKKLIYVIIFVTAIIFAFNVSSKASTTVKVTGDTLNMRKGPSTDTKVVAMLFKGVECEVLDEEGAWYKVQYKSYIGYVSKEYVKIIGESSDTVKNEENVVEENASNNVDVSDENNTIAEENIVSNVNDKEQNNVTDNIEITYKKVNKNLNLKLLPLIYSNDIESLEKNIEVEVLGEIYNWSYIQTKYNCGWVRTEYLDEIEKTKLDNKNNSDSTSTTYTEKTAYISESSVNMRKGPGTSYDIIKILSLNTQLTIIDENGGWYKVKLGNVTGYVSKEYITYTKTTTTRGNKTSRTENSIITTGNNANEEEKVIENITTEVKANVDDVNEAQVENTVTENKIKGTDIVAYAKKYLGYKYVYGGDGTNGTFDCSGFTMYVYKHFGINIPHGANLQYKCGKGTKITNYSDLQIGDIVMLTDYETGSGIGHCGIYIGNDNFIHASTTCNAVEISSFKTIYKNRFYAGLRLI